MYLSRAPFCLICLVAVAIMALARPVRADADFGDAPASYGDASHAWGSDEVYRSQKLEWMGELWDFEAGSLYSSDAKGDDLNNLADEDGVNFTWDSVNGILGIDVTLSVYDRTIRNEDGKRRYRRDPFGTDDGLLFLKGWWDSNRNGAFDNLTELIIDGNFNPRGEWLSNTRTYHYEVSSFSPKMEGDYFRFRLIYGGSAQHVIGPTGAAVYGEVSDYMVTPEPSTVVLLGGALLALARRRRLRK